MNQTNKTSVILYLLLSIAWLIASITNFFNGNQWLSGVYAFLTIIYGFKFYELLTSYKNQNKYKKGGHDNGWMSEGYLKRVYDAIENVKNVVEAAGDDYTIVITTDHGGHDRIHGMADVPEDMVIPMFFMGPEFEKNKKISGVSLLDIAPTIANVMGVPIPREWEGESIVKVEK